MKKLLVVLGLAMLAFSFQAGAATISLTNGSGEFSGTHTGAFTDTFTFTVPTQSDIGASAHNTWVKIAGEIVNFSLTLDGIFTDSSVFSLASRGTNTVSVFSLNALSGLHTLVVSGDTGGHYVGSVEVAETPIPAAVWLFGSALMGLTGMRRKQV